MINSISNKDKIEFLISCLSREAIKESGNNHSAEDAIHVGLYQGTLNSLPYYDDANQWLSATYAFYKYKEDTKNRNTQTNSTIEVK